MSSATDALNAAQMALLDALYPRYQHDEAKARALVLALVLAAAAVGREAIAALCIERAEQLEHLGVAVRPVICRAQARTLRRVAKNITDGEWGKL